MLSRVLGAVGRTFISAGVLILLFVAYQLWGTGILEARAQDELGSEFEDLLEERDDLLDELIDAGLASAEEGASGGAAPTSTDAVTTSTGSPETAEVTSVDGSDQPLDAETEERRQALVNLIWKPPGDAVAQIFINKIGVSKTVVSGVGVDELREGPGHYTSTPLPGMPGNAAIAGHRTTYGAPFGDIDQLDPGDEITVLTVQGTFTYRVVEQENGTGHFIVSPDRVDVLDQDFDESTNRLTLTACHPKFSARQRIIVVAELVGEPAPAVARPDDDQASEVAFASEDLDENGVADDEEPLDEPTPEAAEDLDDTAPDRDEARPTPVADDPPTDDSAAPSSTDGDSPDLQAGAAVQDQDDFGEGLEGDQDAVLPAIFWGAAAGAIWLAAWFIGRRWRPWPSYALGILPFAVALFVCFVHIDQALPSY